MIYIKIYLRNDIWRNQPKEERMRGLLKIVSKKCTCRTEVSASPSLGGLSAELSTTGVHPFLEIGTDKGRED